MNLLRDVMPETPDPRIEVFYLDDLRPELARSVEGNNQSHEEISMKKLAIGLLAVSPVSAFAALDTTPITAAQTDLLAAAAALLALGVAVWGAMKVVRMFGGK
jgi:hypothetical protein